ncbi:hypothetical protein BZL30_6318 [Mycobacterium kansasii]|uniref:Uncharacterized protein n=1 Tax=Mycobacterium kansasii TaxID=1768 RepID=A0A1V3WT12_MYCKA|nr:hypothetical protein BZL30_6318 [Mycobacterium kansasii]
MEPQSNSHAISDHFGQSPHYAGNHVSNGGRICQYLDASFRTTGLPEQLNAVA